MYKGWYVLYVRPRHERKVGKLLQENSLDSYVPLIKSIRKWSDRKKIIEVPLFPSYVLVKINSSSDFSSALSTEGAFGYIQFGREYARVKEEEIYKIKLFLNIEGISNIKSTNQEPIVGERYTICSGPLGGLDCEIKKVNNQDKVIVRIDSIQQSITATVPKHYLSEPLSA